MSECVCEDDHIMQSALQVHEWPTLYTPLCWSVKTYTHIYILLHLLIPHIKIRYIHTIFYARAQVWEVSTAKVLLKSEVMPMNHCARSCALSPDGLLAVAGFDDGSMKVGVYD